MRACKAIAVVLLLCVTPLAFAGKDAQSCHHGIGHVERAFGSYKLRIEPANDEQHDLICRAILTSDSGVEIFSASEVGILLSSITGSSVTNDGVKSLVLQGFTGGAHCCYRYWIVSLGSSPKLVKEIRNQTGIAFENDADARVVLNTADGGFDYFDDLPHVYAPMPEVYLQLEGHDLRDVSAQFVQRYDKTIAEARQSLTPERIEAFRAGSQATSDSNSSFETKAQVLRIVLSYLYSGRDQQAWNALDEMWPAADRERIAKLIVETRARGILAQTSKPQ